MEVQLNILTIFINLKNKMEQYIGIILLIPIIILLIIIISILSISLWIVLKNTEETDYRKSLNQFNNYHIKTMTKVDNLLEELFQQKFSIDLERFDKELDDVYLADVVEDFIIEFESAIEDNINSQRFFIFPKEREKELKTWAKFIPNPANGGDDDFIVFDIFRGEYTFGENGFTPLCDQKELNNYYRDKNLDYIIKQPRN